MSIRLLLQNRIQHTRKREKVQSSYFRYQAARKCTAVAIFGHCRRQSTRFCSSSTTCAATPAQLPCPCRLATRLVQAKLHPAPWLQSDEALWFTGKAAIGEGIATLCGVSTARPHANMRLAGAAAIFVRLPIPCWLATTRLRACMHTILGRRRRGVISCHGRSCRG